MPVPLKPDHEKEIETLYVSLAMSLNLDPIAFLELREFYLKIINEQVGNVVDFLSLLDKCNEKYNDMVHCFSALTAVLGEILAFCSDGYCNMFLKMKRPLDVRV